ncbi:hypothetical protein J2X31_000122 [Flavobacterium arsenatis]|uniref:Type IX secretion system membrane protein PorP/SprF n=1 Tax=Flavobacterium arsenatis TaxID=1484332 RepID=A0ABU1TJM5_9FLAO|nr:hypothetical protein [Flavobacterium arsenatis]MDR6966129.1 hypothetical protein [Flavobacterium arsenatis]
MKKTILIAFLNVVCLTAQAQEEIKFDGLKAPSSPAFNLLGISPSSIDQPTDITSFAVSIQNATSDFSSIPNNYAMEFLPFTLFSKNSMTTKELGDKEFKNVFKQTFLISLGVANEINDDIAAVPKLTKLGMGLKFSIIRPAFTDTTLINLKELYNAQEKVLDFDFARQKEREQKDSLLIKYKELKKEILSQGLSESEEKAKLSEIVNLEQKRKIELSKETIHLSTEQKDTKRQLEDKVSEKAKSLEFKRSGPFLDFALGSVIDFKDETFNRSQLSKSGAWLTGGFIHNSLDILGVARYLYQPDKILADDTGLLDTENISSLDGGVRVVYKTLKKQQLSLSAEGLYRSVLDSDLVDSSWRLVANASYDFGSNQVVTFSFGKDFDNTFIKEDNLVAALNFIIGFGDSVKNDTK